MIYEHFNTQMFTYVRTLLPQVETFPEYDRLTEDGIIEVAVVFRAYTGQEPLDGDWGVMQSHTEAQSSGEPRSYPSS